MVYLEQPLVWILVVVANIQVRTLKTEVQKGSVRTAIGHGSVGPKEKLNCYNIALLYLPKGNQVNILEPRHRRFMAT